jgi:hypothetical protein
MKTMKGGEAMERKGQLQTQQALLGGKTQQTQGGGEAMQALAEPKWDFVRYTLPELADYPRYKDSVERLPEPQLILELVEECTCYEKYGMVLHNNGGEYHEVVRIYRLDGEHFLVVFTNTREFFSVDEISYVVVRKRGRKWYNDKYAVMVKADDYVYILGREDVEKEIRARTDGYYVKGGEA